MAGNWRIRHKLMLGMSLVVALMALLLAGTLKGLASYRGTMRAFDHKLEDLEEALKLKEAVGHLANPGSDPFKQEKVLRQRLQPARACLRGYRAKLEETLARDDGRDGVKEREQVAALDQGLDQVERALDGLAEPRRFGGLGQPFALDLMAKGAPVRVAVDRLTTGVNDLVIIIINDELRERIGAARGEYNSAIAILVTTSALAVMLMAGLLRFFYRWVAHPIRDLEQGVSRIAKGNFDQPIEVNSGDEMQELARAFNDMTEKLREMYTSLAQQVNDRSRQLVRSERMAGVGFLAAGVAHEINNPLASIAFCSEALERRLDDLFRDRPADPTEQETITKYLKMIQEEAFRCKEITARLLAFSRGGDRKRERTDLAGVVKGVLDLVQPLPNCRGKQLVFEPVGEIPAWVNGQEIKQVFLNLVVNALDSMDEGGRLVIGHGVRDGMAELTFTDSGCGMPPDVLENIFEPFFTRSRTGKGTGLGLSISHQIITQHGGDITATSHGPGRGSTFTVRLPIEPPADAGDGATEQVLDPREEFLKLSSAKRGRQAA